jgi:PAS domain S-box-containing protein
MSETNFQTLLEQKNFIEKINNVVPSCIYIFDIKEQKIVFCNERVRDLYGFSPEEFKAMGATFYAKVMHPDDIPALFKEQQRIASLRDDEMISIEYRVRDANNGYHWVNDRVTIFSRENGFPRMVLGVSTDIDERVVHEETMKKTINKLNLSLSAANMGTWEWDTTTDYLTWDERMYEIHDMPQVSAHQLAGMMRQRMVQEDFNYVLSKTNEAIASRNDLYVTYRMTYSNGEIHHVKLYGKFLPGEQTGRMYGVAWDSTEEVITEQQMAEARAKMISSTKMAALGEMSGGIAHEINNPLTVIQARAFQLTQMLESNKLDAPKVKQIAESISRTTEKIARIIRSLRSFARDGALDPFDIVPVSRLVEETLEFCRTRFYNNGIEVEMPAVDPELEVECRLVQIEQVLLNLLNNSFDAIHQLQEKWVRLEVEEFDEHLEIRVVDSGPGIAPEIIDRIMMPFFTTKEVGKGTGLGLSISLGIMRSHHGELYVDMKRPNTVFVMRLPKLQPQETEE